MAIVIALAAPQRTPTRKHYELNSYQTSCNSRADTSFISILFNINYLGRIATPIRSDETA